MSKTFRFNITSFVIFYDAKHVALYCEHASRVLYGSWVGAERCTVFVWFVVKVGVIWVHLSPPPFPAPSQEVCSDSVLRYRSVFTGASHSDWYIASPTDSLFCLRLTVWMCFCLTPSSLSCCLTDALALSPVFHEKLIVWVKDQCTRLPSLLSPIFHPTQTQ